MNEDINPNEGKTVSAIWEERTGTPWSEVGNYYDAYDRSAKNNLILLEQLNRGEWDHIMREQKMRNAANAIPYTFEMPKELSKQQVMDVQRFLSGKGYDIGKDGVDGYFGKNTTKAYQQYLLDAGISVGMDGADGKFGPDTSKASSVLGYYAGGETKERAVDDAYRRILALENNKNNRNGGWDSRLGIWRPHKSVEGGADTIAYGIKLDNGSNWAAIAKKQGYLTDQQALQAAREMTSTYYERAKKVYDKKFGVGSWDKLNWKQQSILVDYEYNVKGGLASFPNLMKAMHDGNINGMLKHYKRYYGEHKPLVSRNASIAKDIESLKYINSRAYPYGGPLPAAVKTAYASDIHTNQGKIAARNMANAIAAGQYKLQNTPVSYRNYITGEMAGIPVRNALNNVANSVWRGSGDTLDSGAIGFLPVIGDALQAGQAISDLRNGNYLNAALGAGLLLAPNALEGVAKGVGKVLKPKAGSWTGTRLINTPGRREADNILNRVRAGEDEPLNTIVTDVSGQQVEIPDWFAASMRTPSFKAKYPNGVDFWWRGFGNRNVGGYWMDIPTGYKSIFGGDHDLALSYAGGDFMPLDRSLPIDYSTAGGIPNMMLTFTPKGELLDTGVPSTTRRWAALSKDEPLILPGLNRGKPFDITDEISNELFFTPKGPESNYSGVILRDLKDGLGAPGLEVIYSGERGGFPKIVHPGMRMDYDLGTRSYLKSDGGMLTHRYDGETESSQRMNRWSPSQMRYFNDINEYAIKNPQWFWGDSEDAQQARRYLYDAGAEDLISDIYTNTPESIRSGINAKKLPNSIKSGQYKAGITGAISNAGKATAIGLAATAALPYALSSAVTGTMPLAAKAIDFVGKASMPSTVLNPASEAMLNWATKQGVTKALPKIVSAAGKAIGAAAPYADTGMMSLWTAEGLRAANQARKRGEMGKAGANTAMAAMPILSHAVQRVGPVVEGASRWANSTINPKLRRLGENVRDWRDIVLKHDTSKYNRAADEFDNLAREAGSMMHDLYNAEGVVEMGLQANFPMKYNERKVFGNARDVGATNPEQRMIKFETPDGVVHEIPERTVDIGMGGSARVVDEADLMWATPTEKGVDYGDLTRFHFVPISVASPSSRSSARFGITAKGDDIHRFHLWKGPDGGERTEKFYFPQPSNIDMSYVKDLHINKGMADRLPVDARNTEMVIGGNARTLLVQAPAGEVETGIMRSHFGNLESQIGDAGALSGSSKLYQHGLLSGQPGDTELYATQKTLPDLERRLKLKPVGSTPLDRQYTSELAHKGNSNHLVEVQMIDANDSGKATGKVAWELFRTMHPEECHSQQLASVEKGIKSSTFNSTDMEITNPATGRKYTPEELLAEYKQGDYSTLNVIVDALSIKKAYSHGVGDIGAQLKHNRPMSIMFNESPEAQAYVSRAIDIIAKSQLGKDYVSGSKYFTNIDFNDVEANKEFLKALGVDTKFASNPDIMRNVFDYWYLQQSSQLRTVFGAKSIEQAKAWVGTGNRDVGGGSAAGAGKNTIISFGSPAYGHKNDGVNGTTQTHLTSKPQLYRSAIEVKKQLARFDEKAELNWGREDFNKNVAQKVESLGDDMLTRLFMNQFQTMPKNIDELSIKLTFFNRNAMDSKVDGDLISKAIDIISKHYDIPYIRTSGYDGEYVGVLSNKANAVGLRHNGEYEYGRDVERYASSLKSGTKKTERLKEESDVRKMQEEIIPEDELKVIDEINDVMMSGGTIAELENVLQKHGRAMPAYDDTRKQAFEDLSKAYDIAIEQKRLQKELARMSKLPLARTVLSPRGEYELALESFRWNPEAEKQKAIENVLKGSIIASTGGLVGSLGGVAIEAGKKKQQENLEEWNKWVEENPEEYENYQKTLEEYERKRVAERDSVRQARRDKNQRSKEELRKFLLQAKMNEWK